ncbi:NAD-dependent epimerase/dehydratase family protein [Novosphingobium sp. BL-52-GroH]
MRVVITGAGGFVGRLILARLLARGDSVAALDTAPGSIPRRG